MSSNIKTLLLRSYPFVKPSKNPYEFLSNNPNHKSLFNFFSTKPQKSTRNIRPLDIVFQEALGFYKKEETLESFSGKNGELKKNLLDLEMEIKKLKENEKKKVGSNSKLKKTFDEVKIRGRSVGLRKEFKDISKDMELLLRHLYVFGYFKDVYISPYRFDLNCFYEKSAHDYVKYALQKFGVDNQQISKSLSDSDAKSVALFGCPSVHREDVKAAQYLRSFFKINEESVCSKCVLNDTCKFRNARKSVIPTLRVDSLLRLLRAYSLEEVSPKLQLTDNMKASVSRLIHQVIELSKVLMK